MSFFYYTNFDDINIDGSFVAKVTQPIEGFHDLSVNYAGIMNAPDGYFGTNWDAFKDCLLDLSWINIKKVMIIHEVLPDLPEKELSIYLEILSYACSEWNSPKTNKLANEFQSFIPHTMEALFKISSCENNLQIKNYHPIMILDH